MNRMKMLCERYVLVIMSPLEYRKLWHINLGDIVPVGPSFGQWHLHVEKVLQKESNRMYLRGNNEYLFAEPINFF